MFMATKGVTKKPEPKKLHGAASGLTRALLAKGIVPYDAMLAVAEEILQHRMVREPIARRLQYLFVDEFQDTDSRN